MVWQSTSRREAELVRKQRRIHEILESFRASIPAISLQTPRETRRVLECVHCHLFDSDLNVAAVRQRCDLRNNNFSSRFRCSVGVSLREYIEAGRVAAAMRLLVLPEIEIYLIAVAVGYEHQETFCRAFQRRAGCSPSQWRESRPFESRPIPTQNVRHGTKGSRIAPLEDGSMASSPGSAVDTDSL